MCDLRFGMLFLHQLSTIVGRPAMMKILGVRVADSKIGKGVFATRKLPMHEVIGEVKGKIVDDPDYGSHYCVNLGGGRTLEPTAPFRYLNHCCEPNCQFFYYEAKGKRPVQQLWLETLRVIQPGEELFIDYAWSADTAIPCLCGHPNCRGWVVDPEELDILLQAKALGAAEAAPVG